MSTELNEKHISFENLQTFKEQYDLMVQKKIAKEVAKATDLSEYAKKTDIVSIARYKGSKDSFAELAEETKELGDIWNIVGEDKDNNIKAGDNLIWNGETWDNLSGMIDLSSFQTKEESLKSLTELEERINQSMENNAIEFATTDDIKTMFYTKKSLTNSQNLADFFGVKSSLGKNADGTYFINVKNSSNVVVNTHTAKNDSLVNDGRTCFSFNIGDGETFNAINIKFGDVVNYSCLDHNGGGLANIRVSKNGKYYSVSSGENNPFDLPQPSNNLSVLATRINETNSCFKAEYADGVFSIINTDGGDIIISNTEGSKVDVASKFAWE